MKLKTLLLVLLSIASLSYANNSNQKFLENQTLDEEFFSEFISQFCSSIEKCTENRIYLNPHSIKCKELGMVLEHDGSAFLLPIVLSDHLGAYIPRINKARPMDITYCLCGWVKFEGDPCKNPDCPYK